MKSSVAFSLLFLLPSIRAAALPQLVGDELESTSSPQKRDDSDNLAPRSPKPEFLNKDSMDAYLAEAGASSTDDTSLDNSVNLERDLSARSPQGPTSNPVEFTDVGLSRVNSADHDSSADSSSSSSSSAGNGQKSDHHLDDDFLKMSGDVPPGMDFMVEDDPKMGDHRHHHHKWNGTHPAWNGTDHHHHNHTWGPMPTATGAWFPTGTAWIPSGTGTPRHHRKVPSAAYAGFRGPKSKRDGSLRG